MAAPRTTLLCALRFWGGVSRGVPAGATTTPTLRKGVRLVARRQGITPRELDKAERSLVKRGLASRPRKGSIALTEKGVKLSSRVCQSVSLAPWDAKATFPFAGARKRRRR
jgi:hypothetical protein